MVARAAPIAAEEGGATDGRARRPDRRCTPDRRDGGAGLMVARAAPIAAARPTADAVRPG